MSLRIIAAIIIAGSIAVLSVVLLANDGDERSKSMSPGPTMTQRATLGGGCFWCVEAVYEKIPGIVSVTSGYAGGKTVNPTYKEVCSGETGHAEVVQIEFDPSVITYGKILDMFWEAHDPTTMNRQGADAGTQYRSIILYENEEQKKVAEESKKTLDASGRYEDPVVTEIVPLKVFYRAEEYHQDYFQKNPSAPYCVFVISPKLKKLKLK